MAPTAAETAPPPAAAKPKFFGADAHGCSTGPQAAIPLALGPLLAPYRARGRLAVRVERMPVRARLSAGRNNGDDSWSLASDELEGLEFQPGVKFDKPHTLAIRIVLYEAGAATTAAVLDYEVAPDGAAATHHPTAAGQDSQAEELRRLREALRDTADRLAESEAALGEARQDCEAAHAEVVLARESWQREAEARLEDAAAEAAIQHRDAEERWRAAESSRLAVARAQWQAKTDAALANARNAADAGRSAGEVAQRRLQGELEALRQTLRARETELAEARSAADERRSADEATQRRLQSELETLHRTLHTREVEVADLREAADRERATGAAARGRLQSELETLRQTLHAREAELAGARTAHDETRTTCQAEITHLRAELADGQTRLREQDIALTQLRAGSQAATRRDDREQRQALAETEARWKTSERNLSALKARCERAEAALQASDEKHDEIVRLRAELAERDMALADANAVTAQLQAAVADAEGRRLDMLAGAERRWKEQAETSARDLQSRCDRAEAALRAGAGRAAADTAELQRLGSEAGELREALAERDAQLEQLRIAAAQTSITAEHGQTLETLEAALAEATARCEATEMALFDLRKRSSLQGVHQTQRMQDEIDTLQAMLAQRDTELSRVRIAAERWYEMQNAEAGHGASRPAGRPTRQEDSARPRGRGLLRDTLLVSAVAVAGVFFYPSLYASLPYSWQAQVPAFMTPSAVYQPAAPPAASAAPAVQTQRTTAAEPARTIAVVTHGVNLRAAPAGDARVLATLKRGAEVQTIDVQGHWTHVSTQADGPKALTGWVYDSYLTSKAANAKAP